MRAPHGVERDAVPVGGGSRQIDDLLPVRKCFAADGVGIGVPVQECISGAGKGVGGETECLVVFHSLGRNAAVTAVCVIIHCIGIGDPLRIDLPAVCFNPVALRNLLRERGIVEPAHRIVSRAGILLVENGGLDAHTRKIRQRQLVQLVVCSDESLGFWLMSSVVSLL